MTSNLCHSWTTATANVLPRLNSRSHQRQSKSPQSGSTSRASDSSSWISPTRNSPPSRRPRRTRSSTWSQSLKNLHNLLPRSRSQQNGSTRRKLQRWRKRLPSQSRPNLSSCPGTITRSGRIFISSWRWG